MANGKKRDPEFIETLRKCATLDEKTGHVTFKDMYASTYINIVWKSGIISAPYAHVVWFLKHGDWPRDDYHIDHINHDTQDNRPANLQEITHEENQKRRRGRVVYRSYGKGKYGYGIVVHFDKRDGRYYVSRHMSRGHGDGDLKNVKKLLGGFDTLEEAEQRVAECVEEIKKHGLDHMPAYGGPNPKKKSIELMVATKKMKALRKAGKTFQQIADETGFSLTAVFNRCKDV